MEDKYQVRYLSSWQLSWDNLSASLNKYVCRICLPTPYSHQDVKLIFQCISELLQSGDASQATHTEAAGSEDCSAQGAAHQWLASQGHEAELRGSCPSSWQLQGDQEVDQGGWGRNDTCCAEQYQWEPLLEIGSKFTVSTSTNGVEREVMRWSVRGAAVVEESFVLTTQLVWTLRDGR